MKKCLVYSIFIVLFSCKNSNNSINGNWLINEYQISSLNKNPDARILAIIKLNLKSIFINEKCWGHVDSYGDTISKMEYNFNRENNLIHLTNPTDSNDRAIIEILDSNSMIFNQKDIAFKLVKE